MPNFKFTREGFFDGTWRKVGDPITLTDRQAKYPLRDKRIVPADDAKALAIVPVKRKAR
jgi:hypothetical protein